MTDQIMTQVRIARSASDRFKGERDWEQVQLVDAYLTEVETMTRLSNPGREWILAPEPVIRRLRVASLRLNERWARNLAQDLQRRLRLYP
jgi:hypothetical protein